MNSWLDGKLLVAAHDTGGAEVIAAWLKDRGRREAAFLLEGPAVKVFRARLGDIGLVSREAIGHLAAYERVLTGSGWGSDLERTVIAAACAKGVPVATYLDHWTNYRERFVLDGVLTLPDELWAGDEHAHRLARAAFPATKIVLEPNMYFRDAVAAVRAVAPPPGDGRGLRVLYICEPRTMNYGQADYWGYDEYGALAGYLEHLRRQSEAVAAVRIRLHPAEAPGKYAAVTAAFAGVLPLEESADRPLAEDCAWADRVVGCDSMAMVVALLAGREVHSCIPRGGRPMTLPYPEIIKLFND